MAVTDLLAALQAAGCKLRLDGDDLRVSGDLTSDLRAAIRQHKAALVAHLRQAAETPPPHWPPRPPCRVCQGRDFWVSRHGNVVCRFCHPPAPGAELPTVRG